MRQFLYEIDEMAFDLPWSKPDLYRLRLWFNDLLQSFPDSEKFDFHILGDYWSSGRQEAWSIVLFASSAEFDRIQGDWPASFAETVYSLLRAGVSLGIERHRLLIELSFSSPGATTRLYQQIQLAESGKQPPENSLVAVEPRFEAVRRVRKTVNGRVELDKDLAFSHEIAAGNGALYERSGIYEQSLVEKASMGRVYYPPVDIQELCGAIGLWKKGASSPRRRGSTPDGNEIAGFPLRGFPGAGSARE